MDNKKRARTPKRRLKPAQDQEDLRPETTDTTPSPVHTHPNSVFEALEAGILCPDVGGD